MIDLKPYAQTLNHRRAAVFGLGVSGLSVVRALRAAGISVVAWDDREDQRNIAAGIGADIQNVADGMDEDFDFLVLSPGVPLTHPEPHDVVKAANTVDVEIIGDIELFHRAAPSLKTIGITGTNGKSTTTALMAHVLNDGGVKAQAAGNIGTPVLDLDVGQIDVLVLELSSYQLDLCSTYRPDISMLLNITPDHLDRHGDLAGYTKAKARILDGSGVKIIGVDTVPTKELFDKSDKAISVSVNGSADVDVQNETLYYKDNEVADVSNFDTLKGEHNYQNLACVYAAARKLGLNDEVILAALKTYPGLLHRQYKCASIGTVDYINDSKATNAEAAAKALNSYDNIYWILGGLPKEGGLDGLDPFMPKVKKAYLIGQASEDFKSWLDAQGVENELCEVLDVATEQAHQDAQNSGEASTVLLAPACASWDQFASFEKRGDAFMQVVASFEKGEAA